MPSNKSTKFSEPVEVQPVLKVPEPEVSGPVWEIVSVQFNHDVDIPNRGKITKVAVGMAGIQIEESSFPDKPGVFIFTNPETMLFVPYSQCVVRYRLVENA